MHTHTRTHVPCVLRKDTPHAYLCARIGVMRWLTAMAPNLQARDGRIVEIGGMGYIGDGDLEEGGTE